MRSLIRFLSVVLGTIKVYSFDASKDCLIRMNIETRKNLEIGNFWNKDGFFFYRNKRHTFRNTFRRGEYFKTSYRVRTK